MYREMKEKLPAKKLFRVKNNNVTANDKRPLLLFYFTEFEQGFIG